MQDLQKELDRRCNATGEAVTVESLKEALAKDEYKCIAQYMQ